jgi:predicted NBD/HSP70 family sugar kinase
VLDGDLHRGETGNAGDFGLMPVPPSARSAAPRPEGAYGILEARASIGSLIRHLRANRVQLGSTDDLDATVLAYPGLMAEWLDDCAEALVIPVLCAARALDIGTVVLDGALGRGPLEGLADRLRRRLVENRQEGRETPAVLVGRIGGDAGALGAAILPLHVNFSPGGSLLPGPR